MASLRYHLRDQLHFLATVAGHGETVVTLQHWHAPAAQRRRAVYVVCYNGVENSRRVLASTDDLDKLDRHLNAMKREHAGDLLSEDAAADEVARRGGPSPRWCGTQDCGAMIPFAAQQCANGCPVDSVGRVEFLSATQRRAAITAVTGGRR